MKKLLIIASLLASTHSFGQTTMYYDSNGSYRGQSIQNGDSSIFLGPSGLLGESVKSGSSTFNYDVRGNYEGQSINSPFGDDDDR